MDEEALASVVALSLYWLRLAVEVDGQIRSWTAKGGFIEAKGLFQHYVGSYYTTLSV